MNKIECQKLVHVLKKNMKQDRPNDLIIGEVTQVDPLKINIGNNIILDEKFLFLGQMCRPHKVKIPHNHILDTHFTETGPSIGSVGAGKVAGLAFEQLNSVSANTTMVSYNTLDDDGNETPNTISKKDLGRGSISTTITVSGQATVVDDSVTITDNEHKHIISKQITKDVHFPKSDYEECIVLEIEPSLQEGDKVLMFAFNNYQMYYVAERIEK